MHIQQAKSILSSQNGMNLYRGCTHGCIYCDSRSDCYQIPQPFEDVGAKVNAPELLEAVLKKKRQRCMIGTGAMGDPYCHAEEQLGLTRRCLKVILQYGFGLAIQTKSCRILRDLELLQAINQKAKCVVQMTLTTYDEDLCRILEPHVSTTRERAEALKLLRDAGIPTIVWISPILPFLNDTKENLLGLLSYCQEVNVKGVLSFGIGMTLRKGNREYFYQQLDRFFPGMKGRYQQAFGNAYECASPHNASLSKLISDVCRRQGMLYGPQEIFSYLRAFPLEKTEQLRLF